ncbi:MAG: fumarylacetoacetate hydrolase family protein [Chloroflexia bacterium]|nr:fumarylacetoacetate hydrolase family protein [Chloroflexia bacterium]
MRLVTYRHPRTGEQARAGVVQGDRILDVARLTDDALPNDMLALLTRGPDALTQLKGATTTFARQFAEAAEVPPDVALARWEATLLAPIPRPPAFRDFYAFEQHVVTAYTRRGRPVPATWYRLPVFYYGHTGTFFGPEVAIPKPAETRELDFELEIACIIGRTGRDIAVEEAEGYIAGYAILNDWSARDVQREEMTVGLGPAKGKDFATSLGPWLVTPDELAARQRDGRLHLGMVARVNGETLTEANTATMHWTFAEMIARASADVPLEPGDIIGSGTVGGGCILELGPERHPWLEPGDEVELDVERLGRLRNTIALPENGGETDAAPPDGG